MDPDVHSPVPGKCPRCGMKLVAGIPDAAEYPLSIRLNPAAPQPGREFTLSFIVRDPKTGKQVTDFEMVHEKLFHMFVVSQDLQFFLHDHPEKGRDGIFRFRATLPNPGMYRILSDFYPRGGTPQLISRSIILPGGPISPGCSLDADLTPKQAANMRVSLTTDPPQVLAGSKTLMFFHLEPAGGLELYLGAWGHMLAASSDLIDLIHNHPFLASGGPDIQFNMVFPRPGVYRVWVQFQRQGMVNTAVFNVPVTELK